MTGVNLGTLFASLLLEDDFSGTFKKYLDEQDKALKKANDVSNGFKVAGAALATFAGASVNAATALNKSMANVATLIPGNTKRIEELKDSVQGMSVAIGKSTDDLSSGLYEVISSLGDTGDTLKILEINAKAGAAGLASTQDALKFTSAVTKTYGDTSAEAFQKVSDLGFQAVNLGQTTFPELAGAIGRVAPLAKETGVSMEEMFAIIATATGVTGNTNEVITQMSAAITAVVSPTAELSEAYSKMGIKSGEALIKQEGLGGALQKLAKYAKDTETPFINLVGRKEAWVIASSLAGAQADSLTQKMAAMQKVAGSTDTAFQEQTQGIAKASFIWEQWKATATVAAQKVGDAILDSLTPSLQAAVIGMSELGGRAVASAGDLAQVALAAKALGAGEALASAGRFTGSLVGITTAATAAKFAVAGIGIAVAAWSLYKVYEAISLMKELHDQTTQALEDAANEQQRQARMIKTANDLIGVSAKDAGEAYNMLRAHAAGLNKELPNQVQWTENVRIAYEKGSKASGAYVEQTKGVIIETRNATQAAAATKPVIETMTMQYERLQKEVRSLTGEQQKQIIAGKELGMNAKQISDELMKLPNATRVSEAAIEAFSRQTKEAGKNSKDASSDIKELTEKMLGLSAIKDATNIGDILGKVGAGALDPEQAKAALSALQAGIDTVKRLGTVGAGVADEQVKKWGKFIRILEDAQRETEALDAEFKNVARDGIKKVDTGMSHFGDTTEDVEKQVKKLRDRMSDRAFGQGLSEEFREATSKARDFIEELNELDSNIGNELNPRLRVLRTELRNLRAEDMGEEFGEMILKSEEFKAALASLILVVPGLVGAIGEVGDSNEKASEKVKKLRGEITSLKGAFSGDVGANFFANLFQNMANGLIDGKAQETFENAGRQIMSQVSKGIGASAVSSLGTVAGGIASMGTSIVLGLATEHMIAYLAQAEKERKSMLEADKMRTSLIEQVGGGSQRQFIENLQRAGVTHAQIAKIMTGDAENVAASWGHASETLQKYQAALKGLDQMAAGAAMIGGAFGAKLDVSKAEQFKPFEEMQKAAIDAMKKAGESQTAIDAQLAAFAEQNKNRVYVATEEQVSAYNRLGTIVGGVIANMAGRTGDLIGATLANKDAILELIEAQKTFGLEGVTTGATQQVIDLYKTILDNEPVVQSIQGVSRALTGMSDAMLQSSDLANAFGGQLAADLAELQAAGVDTAQAFAMAAPALQRLWELQQEGKVSIDETTKALLKQAEEQGVVGADMKDVNTQILDVLKQIRDMFSSEIPQAVPRTTNAVNESARAQQRAANDAYKSWDMASRGVFESWKRENAKLEKETGDAVSGIKERLKGIPTSVPIKIEWEMDDPTFPETPPGTYVEPPMEPTGYAGVNSVTPAGAVPEGRGTQTIIVERDGQRDLQYTAENLPDYVRLRVGASVVGA